MTYQHDPKVRKFKSGIEMAKMFTLATAVHVISNVPFAVGRIAESFIQFKTPYNQTTFLMFIFPYLLTVL